MGKEENKENLLRQVFFISTLNIFMALLQFTQQVAGSTWVWEIGKVIDDTNHEEYWKYWVDNGTVKYLTAEESKAYPNIRKARKRSDYFTSRPDRHLNTVKGTISTVNLPEKGAFNAGLTPYKRGFIMVYRPDEEHFTACLLNKKFEASQFFPLSLSNCADPRLVWLPNNQLLMVYSSFDMIYQTGKECIRAAIIHDGKKFIDGVPFRVSPEGLADRQKNWMPFIYDGKTYLVGSVCPHVVYELDGTECKEVYKTEWSNPWFHKAFLRGNTNIVQLEDGNYLGTFHTVSVNNIVHYYDNGAYIFEGKPPFRVLKCANTTYLKAEDAIEPHFRKEGFIEVCFPVGMVREKNKLYISFGDNDSVVKILETTVDDMQALMVDTYPGI